MDKIFRVKGRFKKKGRELEFTKELPSKSRGRAIERLYSDIGSKHAVKRNLIHISEVDEIKPEEAEDPDIRALAEVK